MAQSVQIDEFAAALRQVKAHARRSYEAVAREVGVSSSTLHRYCAGTKLPTTFEPVEAFARACGVSGEGVRELHRLWVRADATRHAADPTAEAAVVTPGAAAPAAAAGADGVGLPASEVHDGPADSAGPAAAAFAAQGARAGGAAAGSADTGRDRGFLSRRKRLLVLAGAAALAVVGGAGWVAAGHAGRPGAGQGGQDPRLLFSTQCKAPVAMGQQDLCVREVQELLARAGGRIDVDGDFGPQTLRNVTGFQVLAGIEPSGVVDDGTKRALYDGRTSMRTWPASRIERRIREVFTEAPEAAVAIARCQSLMDPLYVLPNTNGSRNWGLFQLADTRLAELGGTPLRAYDPEWNIRAAHELWKQHRDFSNWPHCAGAIPKATR